MLVLTGCGKATVEESAGTSVAPLQREGASASKSSGEASAKDRASSSAASAPRGDEPAAQGDGAAREVEAVPESQPSYTEEDQRFLDAMKKGGVKIEGVESPLIGAGGIVCQGKDNPLSAATVQAVAGQLKEQGLSDKSPEELAALIESSARSAYC